MAITRRRRQDPYIYPGHATDKMCGQVIARRPSLHAIKPDKYPPVGFADHIELASIRRRNSHCCVTFGPIKAIRVISNDISDTPKWF
jgi:hypothetical protein